MGGDMCGDGTEPEQPETTTETAFEFESYFDRDSGLWSLRRVPTSLPPRPEVESEDVSRRES